MQQIKSESGSITKENGDSKYSKQEEQEIYAKLEHEN